MKRIIHIALALILAVSCVYPFDADIPSDIDKTLVVEGSIVIGGHSYVNISCVRTFSGDFSAPPSADITLEEENGSSYPAVMLKPGEYRLFTENANADSRYRLLLAYEGKDYATDWISMTETPVIKHVLFSADKDNVKASISLNCNEVECNYLAFSYQEIWHFHASFIKELGYNPETNSVYKIEEPDETYYWCWRKANSVGEKLLDCSSLNGEVDNWTFASFPRTSNRNHGDYTIKVNARCLTEEEYRYWKLLNENIDQSGNLFTPEPGEISSNIKCISDEETPVYGYVSISKACTASAKLDRRYYKDSISDGLYQIDSEQYPEFYNMGFEPVIDMSNGDLGLIPGWGERRCYNCVAAGGTLEKPEFDR